jgi:hypothetical protein
MSARASACIYIAADVLRAVLSDIPEDWPRSMPRVALRAIEAQEDVLKDCAYRVRYVGECLRELDRECAALRARVEALEAGLRAIEDRESNWAQGVDENVDAIIVTHAPCWR